MLDPVFQVVKGLPVGNAIDKDYTCSTFIVCFSDCFEPFLASCVPNLHFDFDAIDIDSFDFEVDANSGNMTHFILLVDVAEEDVCFSDCSISDDDELDQVVVLLFVSSFSHNHYKLTEIVISSNLYYPSPSLSL